MMRNLSPFQFLSCLCGSEPCLRRQQDRQRFLRENRNERVLHQQLQDVAAGSVTDLPLRIRLPDAHLARSPEVIHVQIKDQTSGRDIKEKTLFWRPKNE